MKGYDPEFLGADCAIPLPGFDPGLSPSVLTLPGILRDGVYSDHIHYTLAMNRPLRTLIYSATNIDLNHIKTVKSSKSWSLDPNFDGVHQLDNDYYKDRTVGGIKVPNPYDRGHMVMRSNASWGDTVKAAIQAGKATYVYSNAALQHENLNKDEWKALELEIVQKFQHSVDRKLTVFTGPIYGDLDRHINLSDTDTARVPSGFFKVICFRRQEAHAGDCLGVLTFAIFQDSSVIRDRKGAHTVKTDRNYQITISELRQLTGIDFGQRLFNVNPLFFFENTLRNAPRNVERVPERIPVNTLWDVVPTEDTIRAEVTELNHRKIIIQSAMINPIGNDNVRNNEWVSLHNRSSRNLTLKDWVLTDGEGREILVNGKVHSGASLKLGGPQLRPVRLNNQGGRLMLYDKQLRVIDHVTWSKHQVQRLGEGIALLFDSQ